MHKQTFGFSVYGNFEFLNFSSFCYLERLSLFKIIKLWFLLLNRQKQILFRSFCTLGSKKPGASPRAPLEILATWPSSPPTNSFFHIIPENNLTKLLSPRDNNTLPRFPKACSSLLADPSRTVPLTSGFLLTVSLVN